MQAKITAWLAVAALVIAACGDDDTTATTGSPSPTAGAATPTTPAPEPPPTTPAPEPAPVTTLPAAPAATTFTGPDGIESTISDTSRIVSLNGDLTEIIFALGLGDRVVAVDITTTYPPETENIPRFGFGQALDAEGVLAFGPTVVIGDQPIRPVESIQQLRDAGVPVVILETQTTLPGIETKILQVAEVLGVPEAGRALADQVNAEIAEAIALAAQVEEQARAAFVYSRGPQQLFLFGRGTVTQALIEGANAVDVISSSGVNGLVPLTPEALVAANPDVIILPASGVEVLGGLEAVADLPGVAETSAGANNAFLIYDDGLFLNFGPRTGEALRQLILDLYPELAD